MRKIEKKMTYGHCKNKNKIKKEFPFQENEIDDKFLKNFSGTVTFDVYLAYRIRRKGYDVVCWGATYKNRRIFMFDKPENKLPLPF